MNTRERSFQSRGKQVVLQELSDLVAVRSKPPRAGTAAASAKGVSAAGGGAAAAKRTARPAAPPDAPPEALPQVRAFEDAGWSFVPRRQAGDGGARVYLKSGGRVALGTDRVSVRVAGDRSETEARDVLARHGFTVLDRLKFAPNLFVAAVPAGEDPLEAVARLAATGDVEFAEPELIELFTGR